MAERTFVMVKPDGVGRRFISEIMGRFEKRGLKLVGLKMQIMTQELAGPHYAEHKERPFFGDLVSFITSGPTVQMVDDVCGSPGNGERCLTSPNADVLAE